MLTSLMGLGLALAVFGLLGRPNSFDASAKLVAIERRVQQGKSPRRAGS